MSESALQIDGTVADGFESVRDAFERNFTQHGDMGGSFALYVDGELKVDLWGGVADPSTGRPWESDTLTLVYSVTKGATAILANRLEQKGALDLDARVADYWPEFAANGKGEITVRDILSHRAGLPVVEAKLSRDEIIAVTPVVEALAAQAPIWEPRTAHGYHALTYGWLMGEIVRRATGETLGALFASEVAAPLGLDFYIGLPESEEPRVAPLFNAPPPDMAAIEAITDPEIKAFIAKMTAAMSDPNSLFARVLSTNGGLPTPDADTWNDPRIRAMEQPAANGVTNARSLARMYAATVSEVDGVRLLTDETLDRATAEQRSGPDEVTMRSNRFASGFMLNSPTVVLLSDASFGHMGAGGALGFADRDRRVGFGYVQNQLGGGPLGDPRTAGLIEAVRAGLGMTS